MRVKVTFIYMPDEPDEGDDTGMSEAEFEQLQDALMELGADNVLIERVP